MNLVNRGWYFVRVNNTQICSLWNNLVSAFSVNVFHAYISKIKDIIKMLTLFLEPNKTKWNLRHFMRVLKFHLRLFHWFENATPSKINKILVRSKWKIKGGAKSSKNFYKLEKASDKPFRVLPHHSGIEIGCAPSSWAQSFRRFQTKILETNLRYGTDGSLFNIACLRWRSRTINARVAELQYADEHYNLAHELGDRQNSAVNLSRAHTCYGLIIKVATTKVIVPTRTATTTRSQSQRTGHGEYWTYFILGSVITSK